MWWKFETLKAENIRKMKKVDSNITYNNESGFRLHILLPFSF